MPCVCALATEAQHLHRHGQSGKSQQKGTPASKVHLFVCSSGKSACFAACCLWVAFLLRVTGSFRCEWPSLWL